MIEQFTRNGGPNLTRTSYSALQSVKLNKRWTLWINHSKIATPVREVTKPLFIGFAILDMSKHIIYDFCYNVLKNTFNKVELLGQDTDSLIVHLKDGDNLAHKMCEMYKSFDFSELDEGSYIYGQLVNYYEQEVAKDKFPTLSSFLNFNKKLPGPIFKDEHNGHQITEFVDLDRSYIV